MKGITDGKVHSKKDRWTNDAAKWFENGKVRISDAETPFLNALRRMFRKFHDLDPKDFAFDAGDAVNHAIKNMPDVLKESDPNQESARRARVKNPLAGIGRYHGYGR